MACSSSDSVYLSVPATHRRPRTISIKLFYCSFVSIIPLRKWVASHRSLLSIVQFDLCLFHANNERFKCGRCDHIYFRWDLKFAFEFVCTIRRWSASPAAFKYPICIKLIRSMVADFEFHSLELGSFFLVISSHHQTIIVSSDKICF